MCRLKNEKGTYEECVGAALEPQRWYHLAVAHSCTKTLLPKSRSECRVYLDGQLLGRFQLKYPKMWFKEFEYNFVGTDVHGWRKQTHNRCDLCGGLLGVGPDLCSIGVVLWRALHGQSVLCGAVLARKHAMHCTTVPRGRPAAYPVGRSACLSTRGSCSGYTPSP